MLVAWDFDGVLNRGFPGGYDDWQQDFHAAHGVGAEGFTAHVYQTDRFDGVLTGRLDILDHLAAWIAAEGLRLDPAEVLDKWLRRDTALDAEVMGWLAACPHPGVIATNSDARRAGYIWDELGFRDRLAAIFASGPLGARKPAPEFFAAIDTWGGRPEGGILLVDDSAENIAAARAHGWQALHFTEATRGQLPGLLGL